jgi:oxalate---CoA ligase
MPKADQSPLAEDRVQEFLQQSFSSRPISSPGRAGDLDLYGLLASQARRNPGAVAILASGRAPLSFGALVAQVDAVRAALEERNFGGEDRIVLLADRGPDVAVAALAIASCAICAPLNPAAPAVEIEQALRQLSATALMVSAQDQPRFCALAERLGVALLTFSAKPNAPAGQFDLAVDLTVDLTVEGRTRRGRRGPTGGTDIALVLRTSGTTSQSKIVPISHRNVVARANNTRLLLNLAPTDRCLNLMPLCYEHGLFSGLLGPLGSGSSVICAPAFKAETFLTDLRELEPTWYTASFTHNQAIFDWLEQHPAVRPVHRLRFARTSSGPIPPRTREGLERILGVPLVEGYGATEAGTITTNPPDGLRKPGTVGRAVDGNVAIAGADGRVLPAGMAGEVVVRGARVIAGYENNPEANRRSFRDGWYRTGDHGFMDADGYISLLGRLDEVINRGGQKIAPREVDDALLAHPAVGLAVSFPIPHPRLHQDVAAAVVPRPGHHVTERELRHFLAERLAAFKIPRRILFTAELPKGPTGKLSRKTMAEHFRPDADDLQRPDTETRSGLQQVLVDLWREVLNRPGVGPGDDFFLCGGDSLLAVDLLCRIEERLQYRVPLGALIEAPSPAQLEAQLERATFGAIRDTVRIHSTGTRRPLFAVGDRGGHVIRLLPLLHGLAADQPCFGLQPPRLDWTRAGCTTVPQMARHYIERIRAIQPAGPYRLFGPSFGGLVVFEIALQLEAMGEKIEFLGIVDTTPPRSPVDGTGVPRIFMNAIPREDDGDSIEAVNIRLAWSHVRARQSYAVDPSSRRLASAMTYFYCTGEAVQAQQDPRRRWPLLAPNGFRLVPVTGLHGSYNGEPQLTSLRNALAEALDACASGRMLRTHALSDVFDRDYRLRKRWGGGEVITGPAGKTYTVGRTPHGGSVDDLRADADGMIVAGWALERPQQPAQTLVAFLDRRCLGYGACGAARPDVARAVAPSLNYAGFQFRFRPDPGWIGKTRPRLFALSTDGTAAELNYTF